MKSFLSVAVIAIVCLQFGIVGSMTSCTKTDTVHDTVIKIQTDTIIKNHTDTLQEKDTLLTVAILTANSWKLQFARSLWGNVIVNYERGGSSNTQSFDNEYMTFNANGTGTYTDNVGTQTSFTWNFTDATNKKLIWVWNLPTPVTITWEDIVYDDAAIRYTESYTNAGNNYVGSEMRIPR
jgi:hypothetical protein